MLGPRGTGKSTWLQAEFPQALYFDLLDEGSFQTLLRRPSEFKERVVANQPTEWGLIVGDD